MPLATDSKNFKMRLTMIKLRCKMQAVIPAFAGMTDFRLLDSVFQLKSIRMLK
jgi:hypothetical protein